MTELHLPNYLGIVNQGREIGERRGLAQLFGSAMQAPRADRPSLLAKMAGTDPATAMAAQKHFDANDETAREKLGQYAAAFDALPDEMKPAEYPKFAQQAQELGIPAPMEWNPDFAPNIQKLAQTLRGAGGYQVQSTKVGADGFIYTIGRDGSFQNTGIKADPNTQILEGAGGFYGVDKRNMQAAPVQMGQPGMQQAPQQRAPGEVPFSIDPSLPPEVQAAIRANEGQFASAPDGANIQIPNSQGQMGGQLQAAPPKISPLQLMAEQRAQEAAQRDQQRLELAQQAANRPKAELSAAEQKDLLARKAKIPQLQNAIRGMGRIESALKALEGGMVNTGPMDAQIQRFTPKGQELDSAVGAIQNSVLSLTRVPGIGAQSDLEARVAMLQYPSLDKPPEVNKRTLDNLKLFMRDLAKAYEAAVQPQQADAPASSDIDSILDKYR